MESSHYAGIIIFGPIKTAQSQFLKSNEATADLIDAFAHCLPQKSEAFCHAVKRKDEEEKRIEMNRLDSSILFRHRLNVASCKNKVSSALVGYQ